MENRQDDANPLGCPVVSTLNVIGGKWKPMVIHALTERPMRFGEIRKSMTPISQKVLTQQLRELEADQLVLRDVNAGNVVTVTYSLTPLGQSLAPVFKVLSQWGETNVKGPVREEFESLLRCD